MNDNEEAEGMFTYMEVIGSSGTTTHILHQCCEVRYLSLCDLTWSLGQSRMRCVSASAAWVYTQQRLQVCSLMSMERIELYEQHYS
jgi:hypothetical protein